MTEYGKIFLDSGDYGIREDFVVFGIDLFIREFLILRLKKFI